LAERKGQASGCGSDVEDEFVDSEDKCTSSESGEEVEKVQVIKSNLTT